MSSATVDELISRLRHADPQVRRLAAMDLTRLAADPIARAALWAVYTNPATPARVAHAAILAHDEAERGDRGGNAETAGKIQDAELAMD